MKSFMKWGLAALVGLIVLGALLGDDKKSDRTDRAAAAGTASTDEAATTPEPTPTETSTPEPTPDPEVTVSYTGPSNAHSDNVVLKGTVSPASAHVRIKGRSVKVRGGRWKLPVTLTKRGDNT